MSILCHLGHDSDLATVHFIKEDSLAKTGSCNETKIYQTRSLANYTRPGTTERLHFHFSLSCIGEGKGSPLQCSCLENPRDGGAWWAAVYGVTQSWTQLKWLSSSSSHWIAKIRTRNHYQYRPIMRVVGRCFQNELPWVKPHENTELYAPKSCFMSFKYHSPKSLGRGNIWTLWAEKNIQESNRI